MGGLISLIMPVTNTEFIKKSIRSIRKQTYHNWELIVVACGCGKEIEKIIKSLNDLRIKLLVLERNRGLPLAFAEGLKLAKGEYIIRHDPDDISLPNRMELQVKYLEEHKEIQIVGCLIKSFGKVNYKKDCKVIDMVQNLYITKEDIDASVINGFIPIIFPTLMIRRDLFRKINVMEKRTDFEDDGELLANLLKLSGIYKINKVLYKYRRHPKAYHIVNRGKYIKYINHIVEDETFKNSIRYRDFYKEVKSTNLIKSDIEAFDGLKILILVDELNIGGTETHVLNLAKTLIKKGIGVAIAASGGALEEAFKLYEIEIIKLPMDKIDIYKDEFYKVRNILEAIIKKEGIQLLHCHSVNSIVIGSEIHKRLKIPYIVTLHGIFYSEDLLLPDCTEAQALIAVSNPVGELVKTIFKEKSANLLRIIPNGVDIDFFKPAVKEKSIRASLGIHAEASIIVYCSRLDHNKGGIAEELIEQCQWLVSNFMDVHLIIIGDGDRKEFIGREAKKVNLELKRDLIHVIGASYDVAAYYLESNFVIGTGRVALEAMSCGKAVIAAGSKGCMGIVTPENKEQMWASYFGDHGFYDLSDEKRLVRSMEYLLKFPEEASRIGRWSRNWCIDKFNNEKLTEEIIELYRETINQKY